MALTEEDLRASEQKARILGGEVEYIITDLVDEVRRINSKHMDLHATKGKLFRALLDSRVSADQAFQAAATWLGEEIIVEQTILNHNPATPLEPDQGTG